MSQRSGPAALRPSGPLSMRAARVLYAVADALRPGDEVVDVLPAVERSILHTGVGAARRTWLLLLCIEWQPLVTFRGRRLFSFLPRDERRTLLTRWERSPAFAALKGWIEAAQSSGA